MMKNVKYFTLLLVVLSGCIEPYHAQTDSINSILVVEGIISGGTTKITLSKSVGLEINSNDFDPVNNALVYVACDDGTRSEAAYYSGSGIYQIATGELKTDAKYCLVIKINDTEYQSEFIPPAITQPVNVSFTCDDDDVHVYVSTQGDDHQTGFYLWSYIEDWEIHSIVKGPWIYGKKDDELILVANDLNSSDNRYYCWGKDSSKIFILGITENLLDNDIHERKIYSFPRTSDRISVLYRVRVMQNRIHREAYDYYHNMQKNNEQTGSIFAHIPSEITGNIRCVSNPDLQVIGYVDVSNTSTDILYLNNEFWNPESRNIRNTLCANSVQGNPFIRQPIPFLPALQGLGLVLFIGDPLYPESGINIAESCVDCTKMGGSKIKPKDWPNEYQ